MHTTLLLTFALQAAAYPAVEQLTKRQLPPLGSDAAKAASAARKNCGSVPCVTFDAGEQFVETTEEHAFVPPGPGDIRGLCPGLNAAANHGYLNRNGISTIPDTVVGLNQAYGMAADLSGFLAAYAILIDGDPILGTWSIGGPPPTNGLGIFGPAQGISYSHNNYEGDASIARDDAFTNNGDAFSLNMGKFEKAYAASADDGMYTLDMFAQDFAVKSQECIDQNPYCFYAPFAGLVAPAAYNFVINFMSNRTAENPNGYLDQAQLKGFFAISGEPGSFVWTPGHERIPDNWYRRPQTNQYTIPNVFQDLIAQFAAYPESLRFGGNTNGVGTFVGVDASDLTGGVMNADSLFEGNNLACFWAQAAQAVIPDFASLPLAMLAPVTGIVNQFMTPIIGQLNCPIVDQFDQTLFNQFPGYKYDPQPPE